MGHAIADAFLFFHLLKPLVLFMQGNFMWIVMTYCYLFIYFWVKFSRRFNHSLPISL